MPQVTFRKAFYIKLGRSGCWEDDSIANGLMRIGWPTSPLMTSTRGDGTALLCKSGKNTQGRFTSPQTTSTA